MPNDIICNLADFAPIRELPNLKTALSKYSFVLLTYEWSHLLPGPTQACHKQAQYRILYKFRLYCREIMWPQRRFNSAIHL